MTLPESFFPHYKNECLLRTDAYNSSDSQLRKLAQMNRGGVAMFLRENFTYTRYVFLTQNVEAVVKPFKLLVATLYRPPTYPLQLFTNNLLSLLDEFTHFKAPTVILGDFNENFQGSNISKFNQTLYSCGYKQLVTDPTTESGTCLDLIFCKCFKQNVELDIQVIPVYSAIMEL